VNEAELCARVYAHFDSRGHEVYGEVQFHGDRMADLVALGPTRWPVLVECKVTDRRALLDQLADGIAYTPDVYGAIPSDVSPPSGTPFGWIGVNEDEVSWVRHPVDPPEGAGRLVRVLESRCLRWNRDWIGGMPRVSGQTLPTIARTRVWEVHYLMSLGGDGFVWGIAELLMLTEHLWPEAKSARFELRELLRSNRCFEALGKGRWRATGRGVPAQASAGIPEERPWYRDRSVS